MGINQAPIPHPGWGIGARFIPIFRVYSGVQNHAPIIRDREDRRHFVRKKIELLFHLESEYFNTCHLFWPDLECLQIRPICISQLNSMHLLRNSVSIFSGQFCQKLRTCENPFSLCNQPFWTLSFQGKTLSHTCTLPFLFIYSRKMHQNHNF